MIPASVGREEYDKEHLAAMRTSLKYFDRVSLFLAKRFCSAMLTSQSSLVDLEDRRICTSAVELNRYFEAATGFYKRSFTTIHRIAPSTSIELLYPASRNLRLTVSEALR
jgi:hypothetical protein